MGIHLTRHVKGIRTITLIVKDKNELVLEMTTYASDLQRTLISLGVLDDLRYDIMINKGYINILSDLQLIVEALKRRGLQSLLKMTNHKRLGHISDKRL